MTPTTSSAPRTPRPGAGPSGPPAVVAAATAPPTGWLADALLEVRHDPGAAGRLLPLAGRRVGRAALRPDEDPAGTVHGTQDDAARAALVLAVAHALADDPQALADALVTLYQDGDATERRGVLRGLDALTCTGAAVPAPVVAAGRALAADALRANDTALVAAAVGPFAAAHLDQHAWRHAVIKLVFQQTSLDAVAGLDDRADDELARMATDLAAERRAAGRAVPADLARIGAAPSTTAHPQES
ncbi:EboA domain-containing protein [Cellulomonas sp. NPDC058312]|uniref:EboA domain-containing protein n=1 Tax=Cellulomonas sp. NPDC058312 TaxID=3346441 RepID=UPI0036EE1B13